MPHSPARPCRTPGCPGFCKPGQVYCPKHAPEYSYDALRGSAAERGYDRRWQKAREIYLRKHPLCVKCRAAGKLTPATVVDHIIPHRGNQQLFWDESNWQPLCENCHNKKTGSGL